MIVKSDAEQSLTCDICGETVEMRRTDLADPEAVMMAVERLAELHRPCEENPDNPALAKLERGFRRRLMQEREKAEGKRRRR